MAGSLNHIVADDGSFTMDTIENMGDAHEALEDCHQVIAALLAEHNHPAIVLQRACARTRQPMPAACPVLNHQNTYGK